MIAVSWIYIQYAGDARIIIKQTADQDERMFDFSVKDAATYRGSDEDENN